MNYSATVLSDVSTLIVSSGKDATLHSNRLTFDNLGFKETVSLILYYTVVFSVQVCVWKKNKKTQGYTHCNNSATFNRFVH